MRPFTDEEFEIMVSEVTDRDHPAFDMLCQIAEKTLRAKVRAWCAADPVLAGRALEDDIMQEIHLRLIKTTLTGFLMREDRGGEINRNPDEFKSWIFKVAERIKIDNANLLRGRDGKTRGFEEGEEERFPDNTDEHEEEEERRREALADAFRIILDSDANICKVLTWLAMSLFMLDQDITKIQSTEAVAAFGEKNLYEIRDIVLDCAKRIDWIVITPEQLERIESALGEEREGRPVGEFKYKELFMKKGGKATISDWVNRMNGFIASRMKK